MYVRLYMPKYRKIYVDVQTYSHLTPIYKYSYKMTCTYGSHALIYAYTGGT